MNLCNVDYYIAHYAASLKFQKVYIDLKPGRHLKIRFCRSLPQVQ